MFEIIKFTAGEPLAGLSFFLETSTELIFGSESSPNKIERQIVCWNGIEITFCRVKNLVGQRILSFLWQLIISAESMNFRKMLTIHSCGNDFNKIYLLMLEKESKLICLNRFKGWNFVMLLRLNNEWCFNSYHTQKTVLKVADYQ